MQAREQTIGCLDCVVVDTTDPGTTPDLAIVLCHGFGAPGTDLVGIGPELCQAAPRLAGRTRFVFPAAPLSLAGHGMPGARAWWHLDIEALNAAIATGTFRDQRETTPDGLEDAREMLTEVVEQVRVESGLDHSQVVLGGFSQGSMIATDVALRLPQPPAALCIWSGTLLCESTWREWADKRGAMRVVQSHGRTDPILPFDAAVWLRDLLIGAGIEVDFHEFPGVHTIPREAIDRTAALMSSLLTVDGTASNDEAT
tara:strand:- start:155 stop:922 length:768 start_codon:yes stop_codon:yes gene_type:complete